MPSAILQRIVAQLGIPGLFEALAEDLAPSDLQSLLLEVYRERSTRTRAAEMPALNGKPLFAPSNVDARLLTSAIGVEFTCRKFRGD